MSPKSLGDFFENFEDKCMKLCKQILFGLKIYLSICFVFGVLSALDNISRDGKHIDCGNFYVAELFIPVTPIACLLSKQVSP